MPFGTLRGATKRRSNSFPSPIGCPSSVVQLALVEAAGVLYTLSRSGVGKSPGLTGAVEAATCLIARPTRPTGESLEQRPLLFVPWQGRLSSSAPKT